MIPRNLNDWTWPVIKELLATGHFEDENFDFKLMLPDSRNPSDTLHLRKIIASFANKNGGFLIYGIDDNKDLNPTERIKGVPITEDYPVRFGNLFNGLTPRPDFTLRNPPLEFQPDRVIHIFHILESTKKPIALEVDKGKFIFPIRTNKGTEEMTYEEIQRNFLGYAHMRDQLQLLVEELKRISDELRLYEGSMKNVIDKGFIAGAIEYEVISICIVNSYGLLQKSPNLIYALQGIRSRIGSLNTQLKFHLTRMQLGALRESINSTLPSQAGDLKREIDSCLVELKNFLETI